MCFLVLRKVKTAKKLAMIFLQALWIFLLLSSLQVKSRSLYMWSTHRSHSQVNRKEGEKPWEMLYSAAKQPLKTSKEQFWNRMHTFQKMSWTKSESNLTILSLILMIPSHPFLWWRTWLKSGLGLSTTTTTLDCTDHCGKSILNLFKNHSMRLHSWLQP